MSLYRLKISSHESGFTLAELLIASVVMIVAFVGILLSYIKCLELSEMSRNSSMAVAAAKSKVEEIKNETFTDIFTNYDQVTFTAAGINGIGVSYIDNSVADLLEIKVLFCWQQKNGLIVGEDDDLDGGLDAGEDDNGNLELDSPVQLVTYIYDE